MQDHIERVRSLAATQHGAITAEQLNEIGMGRHSRDNHVSQGDLSWLTPRVLGIGGAPDTAAQRLLVTVLDAGRGAALSHTSALAHWGVRGFVARPVHVIRRRDIDDHPVRGTVLHEVRFLPRGEVRALDGIPVVSPVLALLQLASTRCSDIKLGLAIDAAWSDRLVAHGTLTAIDRLMSRQGRRGLVRFRELVERRGPEYVPPASNLEARFAVILERAGREPMRRQVDTCGDDGWIGRVDFRDERLPVVAEIQSERFHSGLLPTKRDAERVARLRASGIEVVEITDTQIFFHPDEVLTLVDAARARAARDAAA